MPTIARSVLIVVASVELLFGCAHDYRTPLKGVTVPARLSDLRIGFLDVMVVPPVVEADRTVLLAFPDEMMFLRRRAVEVAHPLRDPPNRGGTVSSPMPADEQRIVVPRPVGLGITETFVLALRDAGLRVERYKSVGAATEAGVDLLVACVLNDRRVVFDDFALEATAEIVVTVLEIRPDRMWTRSLSAAVRIEQVIGPVDDGGRNAMLPLGEAQAQSARTAVTQAYYNLAMDLAKSLATDVATTP